MTTWMNGPGAGMSNHLRMDTATHTVHFLSILAGLAGWGSQQHSAHQHINFTLFSAIIASLKCCHFGLMLVFWSAFNKINTWKCSNRTEMKQYHSRVHWPWHQWPGTNQKYKLYKYQKYIISYWSDLSGHVGVLNLQFSWPSNLRCWHADRIQCDVTGPNLWHTCNHDTKPAHRQQDYDMDHKRNDSRLLVLTWKPMCQSGHDYPE